MAFEIVDGHTGSAHISSEDLAPLNVGIVGAPEAVFSWGDNFSLTMSSANAGTLGTGAGMVQGRRFWNKEAASITVTSGTSGMKRNDLVVARYAATSDGIESVTPVVLRGTPSSGTAADPDISPGDLKLWRIPIDGISVGTPVQLFAVSPSLKTIGDSVSRKQTRLGNSLTCYVEGGICIVSADFLALPYGGANVTIGSLPDGLKPLSYTGVDQTGGEDTAYIGALRYRGYDANFGQMMVTNSGSIMAYANVGGIENAYFYGQVVFPVTRS